MNESISLSVFGILCIATSTALAGPPARVMSDYSEDAHCPLACVVNVAPQLSRASLYGTVVPRRHQKSSTPVRWGNEAALCPQSAQMARRQ